MSVQLFRSHCVFFNRREEKCALSQRCKDDKRKSFAVLCLVVGMKSRTFSGVCLKVFLIS